MSKAKPLLGITMGDPAGVGPEICLDLLNHFESAQASVPIIFGDAECLRRAAQATGKPFNAPILALSDLESLPLRQLEVPSVLDFANVDFADFTPGEVTAKTGQASFEYIIEAIRLANNMAIDAVVTAPINKYALSLAGINYPGHTEILKERTDSKEVTMMLTADNISCSLVTTHIGLADVPKAISTKRISQVIRQTEKAMRSIKNKKVRLAVLGLNPHAGESGLFGNDEESLLITPAIQKAVSQGMDVIGPLPADTAFIKDNLESIDAFICMYHDQGLIPVKLLAFDSAVNVTLGLPILRTSVDHGTALGIAWKGLAKSSSLVEAVRLACLMSAHQS
tara:strand:+ start:3772 stop:4785 length:1014 start_codon:yes stop_codon:yes gene_type:complete